MTLNEYYAMVRVDDGAVYTPTLAKSAHDAHERWQAWHAQLSETESDSQRVEYATGKLRIERVRVVRVCEEGRPCAA